MGTVTTASFRSLPARRSTGHTSDGTLWQLVHYLSTVELYYSTNEGSTWTAHACSPVSLNESTTSYPVFMVIDVNDFLWLVQGSSTSTDEITIYWSGEALTTSGPSTLNETVLANTYPTVRDVVVRWWSGNARVSVFSTGTNVGARISTAVFIGGTTAESAFATVAFDIGTDMSAVEGRLDFAHNGDGKTATSADLHLVHNTSTSGAGLRYRKIVSELTVGSAREVVSLSYGEFDVMFDGARTVVAYTLSASNTVVRWWERNSSDTTSTERTPATLSDGAVEGLALAGGKDDETRLYVWGATSDDPKKSIYDRSLNTFTAWEALVAATITQGISVPQAFRSGGTVLVYDDGDIKSVFDVDNSAPLAPTWVSPSNNSTQNINNSLTLDWSFNDDGDTQSAYVLERVVDGGSAEYLTASGPSWGASEVENASSTSAVTLASSWATNGQVTVYKVKTLDSADEPSPWSSGLTITGSTPINPVLVTPANAATITGSTLPEVTWTATEQTAYRGRVLDGAEVLEDTGKVTTTVKSWQPSVILPNGTTGSVEVRVWNDADLESATPDSHTFTVTFVAPATPTIAVTASDADGRIRVVVTNPTPTGSQPTVFSHDLYVRVASGGRQVGERVVGGSGIRIATGESGTTLDDYAAASGVDFEYRVRAVSLAGSDAYSAWSS